MNFFKKNKSNVMIQLDNHPNTQISMLKLTWPIFIELTLTMLVGNVNQYMITSYSENAVGAIGNANQIINMLLILFSIISMSTTILVSQYIGSNNKEKLSIIYTLSIFVNMIFSVFIALVILLFNKQIFVFMKLPSEIMADARTYIRLVGGFIFLQGIIATFSAIFKSNKMMKETMQISIYINVFNVIGNALLINGTGPFPAMGVAGSAWSTNISRLIGVFIYIYLFIKKFDTKISLKVLRPFPVVELNKLLGVGIPSGGESISYSFAMTYIMKIVNTFGKAFIINTKVLISTFSWFSYMYALALGQASQVVIGNYMGAGEIDKVDKHVKKTLRNAILVSITMSVLLFLFSDFLFGLFSDDPRVLALGKKIMFIEIILEIGKSSNITLVRSLQATGDSKFPMMIGIISMWLIACGVGFYLGVILHMGLVGVWIGMALDECIRAVIFVFRFKSGKWKQIRLANN